MSKIQFPALVKDTGCKVLKVHIPESAHPWILKGNPSIKYVDSVVITRIDGTVVNIENARLSKGANNSRYISIPHDIVKQYHFKVNDNVKVELKW